MPFPNPDTQFRAGESGNPAGRPRGQSITARLRSMLDRTDLGGKEIPNGRTIGDIIAETVIKQALAGDHRFLATLLERTEGLPGAAPETHTEVADAPKRIVIPDVDVRRSP